jgi:hypothetical protein
LNPDSTTITARSRFGSTDAEIAAFSMIESYRLAFANSAES